jgi:hypothetical protein
LGLPGLKASCKGVALSIREKGRPLPDNFNSLGAPHESASVENCENFFTIPSGNPGKAQLLVALAAKQGGDAKPPQHSKA